MSEQTGPPRYSKQEAENRLRHYLEDSRIPDGRQPSISVIESLDPFIEIIHQADACAADLIVMGMHGKMQLRDRFAGTTIERVLRKGTQPVLMVKDQPLQHYKQVVVGTDFSLGSHHALQTAADLVPDAFFHILHSYAIPDTYIGDKIHQYAEDVMIMVAKNNLKQFISEHDDVLCSSAQAKRFASCVIEGHAHSCLQQEVRSTGADLLAIGVHNHESLLPYRIGGTAREIILNPPCDVLIAKKF